MKRINLKPKTHGLQFTSNWVSRHIPTWKRHLKALRGRKGLRFLEIGSWEGRSACWFLENVLTHPSSRIICIDTFQGAPDELKIHKHLRDAIGSIERHFDHNIRFIGAQKKVRKIKGSSRVALRTLPQESFDLIYIDGSHLAGDVLLDAALCWDLLKTGGIMIFDDYRWKCVTNKRNPLLSPRLAIDVFKLLFKDRIKVLSIGTQVILRKLKS